MQPPPAAQDSNFYSFLVSVPGLITTLISLGLTAAGAVFAYFRSQNKKIVESKNQMENVKRDLEEMEKDMTLFSVTAEKCVTERKKIEAEVSVKFERIMDILGEIKERLSRIEGHLDVNKC